MIGTAAGPHPYPAMVRDFQSHDRRRDAGPGARGRGAAARRGRRLRSAAAPTPSACSTPSCPTTPACGWSASRRPVMRPRHAAARRLPQPAAGPASCTATSTYLLQDAEGQILDAHSISAGLDYPGIGPEHSFLHDIGRAEYRHLPPTRRPWPPSQLCAQHRGDHPRARTRPCQRPRPKTRPHNGPGRHRPDEPLRPRRQRHLLGRRASRGETLTPVSLVPVPPGLGRRAHQGRGEGRQTRSRWTTMGRQPSPGGRGLALAHTMSRIDARFAALKAEGRAALIGAYPRWPAILTPDTALAIRARPGRRRGRLHRDRLPLFRSDGRRGRPSSAASQRGAEGRNDHCRAHARPGAPFSAPTTRDTPIILMGYLNPIACIRGYSAVCRRLQPPPGSTR